jgi:uncharacterized protein (DUF2267 family)
MDYREFLEDIKALEFIEDDDTADAAIKTVLGVMSGSLKEEDAKGMTGILPQPLDMWKLRTQKPGITPLSYDQCVSQLAQQFHMDEGRARDLADAVLRSTRAALGGDKLGEMEAVLPESWRTAIEDA